MKRFGTIFLILFSFVAISAKGQTSRVMKPVIVAPSAAPIAKATTPIATSIITNPQPDPQSVLTTTQYDTIVNFDTTGGAVFLDLLNDLPYSPNPTNDPSFPGDSLVIGKSVDEFGSVTVNNTPISDTFYKRVAALRFITPTDIKSPKIVSVTAAILPEAFDPRDTVVFSVVPMVYDTFSQSDGTVVGVYQVPDVFAESRNFQPYATGFIPASQLTIGQENMVTVNFGGKALYTGSKVVYQTAIIAFDEGPGFYNDSLAFLMDFSPIGAEPSIDTDGTANGGSPMLSYWGSLDGGSSQFGLVTNNESGFLTGIYTADANGDFIGNFAMSAVFEGTANSSVSQPDVNVSSLDENYPNPVSSTSEINYNLGQSGPVSLVVYNQLGQTVASLVNSVQDAGSHSATFNAGTLPDGMYYYKLQSGDFTATRTLVIAR